MNGSLRLNTRNPRISLRSSHLISINHSTCFNSYTRNKTPISHTTSRTSTHHSNHTRREGVVETSEEEVEEEDLVEGDVKLCAVTLDNRFTMLEIV